MSLYARLDWLFLTRDPGTFLMWSVSDIVLNIASVTGMFLISVRFSGVGVWSQPEFVFMLGYGAIVEGLVNLFFGYNVSFISRRLGRGQLDHTLIQPQPLWVSLLTEGFSPAYGLPTLVPGGILLGWGLNRMYLHPGAGWFGLLVLNFVASVTIVMSFQFSWGSLAFWAPRAAEEINSSTNQMLAGLKSYPLNGLAPAVRIGLLTALPVGFVAWAPAGALIHVHGHGPGVWTTVLAAVFFAVPALLIFHIGLRHYESRGAQRYSDFGHRR